MRFEQIITAVARQVVVSTVREIKAVMSFLNGGWPHFSQQRNANGVLSYANGLYLYHHHPDGAIHSWNVTSDVPNASSKHRVLASYTPAPDNTEALRDALGSSSSDKPKNHLPLECV